MGYPQGYVLGVGDISVKTFTIIDHSSFFEQSSLSIVNSKIDQVKLEDPIFEKMFEVYSDDQVEARYLLTVTFIERLKELVENFGGKSIQCCFYNNKLLMMIPIEKDMFEPGSIYEAEDFIDDSKSLLKELSLIFSIIDTLKLNMEINL